MTVYKTFCQNRQTLSRLWRRPRLRGTSPERSIGRKSFPNDEEYPRTTAASRPQFRSRHSKIGGQSSTAASWGVDKRPWTVGGFDDDSMDNLAAFAKAGTSGPLRRVRSADNSAIGLSSLKPQIGLEGSYKPGKGGNDGDSDDDDECVELAAVSSAAPPQFVRRVSFADGGGDFLSEETDDDSNRRNSRRLSSLIDGGYSDIDLVDCRRASDAERQRNAMELVRAAHELMFTDTRPDGIRPITGSPMADGKGAGGSGGLYVGLAGLRGFDLSFLGAAPAQNGERLPVRLSHRSAEFSTPAPTSTNDVRRGESPPPASDVDVSWLEQGFLLDREPGSLMPRVPGEDTRHGDSASVGSDVGIEGDCGRPLTPSFQDPTTAGVTAVREGGENPEMEKGEGTSHLERNRTEGGCGVPGSKQAVALSRSGATAESMASASATISTQAMPATAPTAAAGLFFPQAAVLWSPANVSIDDLVLTVAGRRDPQARRPTGGCYTSQALLAAYKEAGPVFEVEASRWTKHEGALPGVDYPAPPEEWQYPNNAIPAEDKESAWNAFERRPVSRAEAGALREIRISRGREKIGLGSTGRSQTGGGTRSRRSRMMPYLLTNFSRSPSSRDAAAEETTCRHPATEAYGPQLPVAPMLSPRKSESRQLGADIAADSSAEPGGDSQSNACSAAIDRDRDSPVSACSGRTTPPSEFEFEGDDSRARLGLGTRACELPSIPPVSLLGPSSGLGMVESAFHLRGEADADNVMRAMMRLSKSMDEIPNEPRRYNRKKQRETHISGGEAIAKIKSSGAPRDKAAGGLIKGATPAIKSGSCGQLHNDTRIPSLVTEVPYIEGRTWRCGEGMTARGSRKSERRARTTGRSPVESTRDQKSVPQRRRHRVVPHGHAFVPVLSKSATAPRIGLTQSNRKCSTASLNETLMTFGFAGAPSANPIASSASQPFRSRAASISDLPSDSTDLRRCDTDQHGSPYSGVSRGESVRQQQRSRQSTTRPCTLPVDSSGRRSDSSPRSKSRRSSNGKLDPGNGKIDPRNGKLDPGNGKLDPGNGKLDPDNGKLDPGMKKNRVSVDRGSALDDTTAAEGGHTSDADDKTTGEQMSVIIADVTRNAASSLSAELTEGSVPSSVEGSQLLPFSVELAKVSPAMDSQPAATTSHESFALTATVTSTAEAAPEEQSEVGSVPLNSASGESIIHPSTARDEGGSGRGETKNYELTGCAAPSDPQAGKAAAILQCQPDRTRGGAKETVEASKSSHGNGKSDAANEQVVADGSTSRTLPPARATSNKIRRKASLQVGDNASGVFVDDGKGKVGNHQVEGSPGGRLHSSPTEPEHRADINATGRGGSQHGIRRSRLDLSNSEKTNEGGPKTPGSSTSSRSTKTSSGSGSSNRNYTPPHQSERDGHTRNGGRANQASSDDAIIGECKDPKTDSLPRLARHGGVLDRGQGVHGHRLSTISAVVSRTTAEGLGDGGGVGALPAVSSGKVGDASRRKKTVAAATNSFSVGGRDVKVHRRPVRVESKDLKATTEALTTHHLTVDDLLKADDDDLLDNSGCEDRPASCPGRTRKEPLMVPQGARPKGVNYWQAQETKERESRRQTGFDGKHSRATDGRDGGRGDNDERPAGGEHWANEKEEVKHLLAKARKERETKIAMIRAQRELAKTERERETLKEVIAAEDGEPSPVDEGAVSAVAAPEKEGSRLPSNRGASEAAQDGVTARNTTGTTDAGGNATVAPAPCDDGDSLTKEHSAGRQQQQQQQQQPGEDVVKGGSGRDKRDTPPPWKGFTLTDDGEATLQRGRAPPVQREPYAQETQEDWEHQLIVPGRNDELVNFYVDTVAVRSRFQRLRKGVEVRHQLRRVDDGVDGDAGDDVDGDFDHDETKSEF